MPNPDNLNSPSYGNLKVLNVTRDLLTATEDDFVFTVPSGGVGQLREATYHLVRSAALGTAGTGGNTFTSELIRIKSLEVVKRGASERTNLLSGTPNIMEFGGDGSLTRMFTVIEQLENNEDIIITVRNDDAVTVNVSLTLNMAVIPAVRNIAAQPAQRVAIDI